MMTGKTCAVALLVAAVGCGPVGCGPGGGDRARSTETVEAKVGTVERTVESAGKVVSNLDVDIKCRASGPVVDLPVDISQVVHKDQLLCQLDPTDEQLTVDLATAAVAQSTAKLEQARLALQQAELNLGTTRTKVTAALDSATVKARNLTTKAKRQRELIAQRLGSAEEAETAETDAAAAEADRQSAGVAVDELKQQAIQLASKRQDVATAEAALTSDAINLKTQRQQLDYTTVKAPSDGTVSALDVQLGTIVASGTGGFSGGTTILTLSDLSRVFVMATVDESDIGGVDVGQPARVVVDSFPDRTFAGKVVRIAVTGVSASNVVTFEVKVEVTDPDKRLLKPQMTGTVTVVEDRREHVLSVPTSAVSHEKGKAYVQTPDGKRVPVTLGMQGTDVVEVTAGLTPGQRISAGSVELKTKWKLKQDDDGGPP